MAPHCIGALPGADSGLRLRRRARGYAGACAHGGSGGHCGPSRYHGGGSGSHRGASGYHGGGSGGYHGGSRCCASRGHPGAPHLHAQACAHQGGSGRTRADGRDELRCQGNGRF